MKTKDALISLETVLRCALSRNTKIESLQVGICRVEWSRSEWKNSPVISGLNEEIVPQPPTNIKKKKRKRIGNGDSDSDSDADAPQDDVELFFGSRVSSWLPSETLTALGVDSLDEVQLRNDFQREFHVKVPLSMFVVPNQTLRTLCSKLKEFVDSNKNSF